MPRANCHFLPGQLWHITPTTPTSEWLGLFTPEAPNWSYLSWRHTTGGASGSVPFTIPGTVAPGTYQLRLFQGSSTYLATSNNFTVNVAVSGTVTLGGSPLAGVVFTATNGGTCTASTASGQYSCAVPQNWSGTVTPSLAGYSFTPASRNYTSVTSNQTAQDYAATAVSVSGMFFIHTDHLSTPRLITNQAGQAVWRWDQADPFGGNVPNENPSGLGTFTCNLRLPGQYFDKETNLHYNYFRDYDPATGRYPQSDPIGLAGGVNTYIYAYDNPLSFFDPDGLEVQFICRPVQGTRGRYSHCFVNVTCPPEGIDVTLSFLGRLPYYSATGYKSIATPSTFVEDPNYPDNPRSPNNQSFLITPKNNCGCDYEKSVIAKFNAAPATQPYYAFGFNSNSFAQNLVTSPMFGTVVPSGVPQNAIGINPSSVGIIRR